MKVIILNSAPGVGKTTLLKQIEKVLQKDFAVLDGDDVGRLVPLSLSIEWLDLIQENIVSCAINYRDFGVKFLIVSFVFPSENRLHRLTNLLACQDIKILCIIALYCNEVELEKRIQKRNTTRIMNIERAINCNRQIKQLKSDFLIDTTKKPPEAIADIFCSFILKITSEECLL